MIRHVAWLLLVSLLLIPVLWMLSGSTMDMLTLWSHPPRLIPRNPTLINYQRLLTAGGPQWWSNNVVLMPRWLLNTAMLTTGVVVVSVLSSAACGYVIRGRWLVLIAATMIIPMGALIIPLFRWTRFLGIQGTLLAAALPELYWPLGIILYRAYLHGFAEEIRWAALIDGAGEFRIFRSIILPLTTPALGAMALLQAMAAMGGYVWQWVTLREPARHTWLIGLSRMVIMSSGGPGTGLPNPVGLQMAAGVLMLAPVLLVFLLLRKYYDTRSFIHG